MTMTTISIAVLVGIGATLFMDLWAVLLRYTVRMPVPNYCLVGRWLSYMPSGTFKHANITTAPKKNAECATGWIFHYLTGIAYALLLIIITSDSWLEHPTLLPALAIGIGTVVIPYFIMQPAFGLGIAAAKTPNPLQARLKSLMTHTVFGVGLYVSAWMLSHITV